MYDKPASPYSPPVFDEANIAESFNFTIMSNQSPGQVHQPKVVAFTK